MSIELGQAESSRTRYITAAVTSKEFITQNQRARVPLLIFLRRNFTWGGFGVIVKRTERFTHSQRPQLKVPHSVGFFPDTYNAGCVKKAVK